MSVWTPERHQELKDWVLDRLWEFYPSPDAHPQPDLLPRFQAVLTCLRELERLQKQNDALVREHAQLYCQISNLQEDLLLTKA